MKARFDRQEYLAFEEIFEVGQLDDVTKELCEFSDDIEDMAYELAYTRYALAKAEARHNALVEAAKPVAAWWRKERMVAEPPYQTEHVVLGTDGPECVGVVELDALTALVGDE